MNTKFVGRWGEVMASEYLRKKGYKVIGLGFTTRFGEIDVIAQNRKYIVFVEVKTRKNADFAEAREYVNESKRRKILTSAEIWLSQNETALQPRFDVIEIYAPEGVETKKPTVNHIENAFYIDY